MMMFNFLRDKIKKIEKERLEMSRSHKRNYKATERKIKRHKTSLDKSDIQRHVEKELSRHF